MDNCFFYRCLSAGCDTVWTSISRVHETKAFFKCSFLESPTEISLGMCPLIFTCLCLKKQQMMVNAHCPTFLCTWSLGYMNESWHINTYDSLVFDENVGVGFTSQWGSTSFIHPDLENTKDTLKWLSSYQEEWRLVARGQQHNSWPAWERMRWDVGVSAHLLLLLLIVIHPLFMWMHQTLEEW